MRKLFLLLVIFTMTFSRVIAGGNFVFPENIKPLLSTLWGQDEPYNMVCPWETVDGKKRHCKAGCLAVAMAQVIRYNQYPAKCPDGSVPYLWNRMLPELDDYSTIDEKLMVAKLINDCGHELGLKYGTEVSGGNIVFIPSILKSSFRYSKYMFLVDRKDYNGAEGEKAWRDLIFNELKNGRPVI